MNSGSFLRARNHDLIMRYDANPYYKMMKPFVEVYYTSSEKRFEERLRSPHPHCDGRTNGDHEAAFDIRLQTLGII